MTPIPMSMAMAKLLDGSVASSSTTTMNSTTMPLMMTTMMYMVGQSMPKLLAGYGNVTSSLLQCYWWVYYCNSATMHGTGGGRWPVAAVDGSGSRHAVHPLCACPSPVHRSHRRVREGMRRRDGSGKIVSILFVSKVRQYVVSDFCCRSEQQPDVHPHNQGVAGTCRFSREMTKWREDFPFTCLRSNIQKTCT